MKFSVKTILVLCSVWVAAIAIAMTARSARPSPEKLLTWLQENPVEATTGNQRMKLIDQVASKINRLDFEQRRTLQRSGELRSFFENLDKQERERFVEKTLPEGFRQMMNAFNQMEPERRKRFVEQALADIERADQAGAESQERRGEFDEATVQKIINEGLQAFYSEASADVKMDFAPVIERMQKSLQNFR
jgi:hypothetical protein